MKAVAVCLTSLESAEPVPWYSKERDAPRDEKKKSNSRKRDADRDREDPQYAIQKAQDRIRVLNKAGSGTRAQAKSSSSSGTDMMQKLREERLRRENMEHERVRTLGLSGKKEARPTLDDERKAAYSSAFNPEFQRKRTRFET